MMWYQKKLQGDLSSGQAPEQGLPFDQQRKLAAATDKLIASEAARSTDKRKSWTTKVSEAKEAIDARNEALAESLHQNITGPDSGFSYNVATGADPGGNPLTAVSIYPERQTIVPRAVRAQMGNYHTALAAFIKNNHDLLQDPNLAVGGWVVKAPTAAERRAGKVPMRFKGREVPEGSLVLDVVATPSNKANNAIAKSLGMEYLQDSIFDLEKFANIKTGGQSFAKGSPAAMREAQARRPGIYERAQALDPGSVDARLTALEHDPRLTESQRRMIREWRAEQESSAPAAAGVEPP